VSGGVWDDISTTPKPCGLSTPNALGGLGQSGVKRPSGLHHQVWSAEEEQVEEEEEEEEEEEDEWNFPGSLNTQRDHAAAAAKYGFGASSMAPLPSAKEKKHMAPPSSTSAWGFSTTTPSTTTAAAPTTTATKPVSSSHPKSTSASAFASRKHQVTMEEIPDESEYPSPPHHHHHHHHHHHQHSLSRSSNSLAYDSRAILEPKPTKPSSMLDDIIQFGSKPGTFVPSVININNNNEEEEGEEEEDYRSLVEKHYPTVPRVVNANANIPDFDIDPAILQRAALEMRQGEERFGAAVHVHAHAHATGAGTGSTTGAIKPKSKKKTTRGSLIRRRPRGGDGELDDDFEDENLDEDEEGDEEEGVNPGFWTHADTKKRWEESEEDWEREQGILNSRQKLKDLFGSGGGGGGATTNIKKPSVDKIVILNPETDMSALRGQALKALKEKEAEAERGREESQIQRQHQYQRQIQEQQQQRETQSQDKKPNVVHPPPPPKAEKEKEKEGASKLTTTGGKGRAKKGKGRK